MNKPHIIRAAVYFGLSLIVTSLFVRFTPKIPGISNPPLILSLSIAGGKWVIQIVMAMALLRKRLASFIHGMGRVCLLGSMILIPYTLSAGLELSNDEWFFFGSILLAILVMVFRYHIEVTRLNLSLGWWYFWLLCLAIAVGLQLTLVFHLF